MKLLSAVEKNVIAQPESARQTFVQFDAGFGDAIVTYEDPLGAKEPEYFL